MQALWCSESYICHSLHLVNFPIHVTYVDLACTPIHHILLNMFLPSAATVSTVLGLNDLLKGKITTLILRGEWYLFTCSLYLLSLLNQRLLSHKPVTITLSLTGGPHLLKCN